MPRVNQNKLAKVASDNLKDKIYWRIVDGEATELTQMFSELVRLETDWIERCDEEKTSSRKRYN